MSIESRRVYVIFMVIFDEQYGGVEVFEGHILRGIEISSFM
jgi:hypothetical protein